MCNTVLLKANLRDVESDQISKLLVVFCTWAMCSFQLSDVSRMRSRYFRVNVNVAVSPSIMTGGRWLMSTVLLARIITDVFSSV